MLLAHLGDKGWLSGQRPAATSLSGRAMRANRESMGGMSCNLTIQYCCSFEIVLCEFHSERLNMSMARLTVYKPYLDVQPTKGEATEHDDEDGVILWLESKLAEIQEKLRLKKLQRSRSTKKDGDDHESEYDSDDSYQSTQEDEDCYDEDKEYYCKPTLAQMKQPDFSYETKLARTIRQWNMYTAGDHATSSRPWTRAAIAEQTRKELDKTVETMRETVNDLQCDVENFARSVTFHHS